MKKRAAIAAALVLAIAAIAALLFLRTAGDGAKTAPEPITFTFYSEDGVEDPWTDPVARRITERTGVTLDVDYPSAGETNRVQLMVATGEYPDLIFAKSDATQLIQHDVLIDMAPLIEQYGPNIKALYGEEYDMLRAGADDPAIYQLCSDKVQEEMLESAGTAQLQWAVMRENDYEIPRTLEQYTDMIRRYKQAHPTIGGRETIGLSIVCTDWHWYTTLSNPAGYIANGSPDNGQWIIGEDGAVGYKHALPEQKEYFRWLNAMYAEGLLDPEFATQTHEDYLRKIAQGRVLGLMDADWGIAEAEQSLRGAGMTERTYAALPVTMDESVPCRVMDGGALAVGCGIGITTSCKDPVRAVQFLDWMCSEEAQILVNWGIEGVNYVYDESGRRVKTEQDRIDAATNPDHAARTGVGFHVYPFPSYGNMALDSTGNPYSRSTRETVIAGYDDEERAALDAWGVDMLSGIFPDLGENRQTLPPLWVLQLPPELAAMLDALDAAACPGLIDCIVCPPDDFDEKWDALQAALIDAGVEQANAMMNELVRKRFGDI